MPGERPIPSIDTSVSPKRKKHPDDVVPGIDRPQKKKVDRTSLLPEDPYPDKDKNWCILPNGQWKTMTRKEMADDGFECVSADGSGEKVFVLTPWTDAKNAWLKKHGVGRNSNR